MVLIVTSARFPFRHGSVGLYVLAESEEYIYQDYGLSRQQAEKHNRMHNFEGRKAKMSCVQFVP